MDFCKAKMESVCDSVGEENMNTVEQSQNTAVITKDMSTQKLKIIRCQYWSRIM